MPPKPSNQHIIRRNGFHVEWLRGGWRMRISNKVQRDRTYVDALVTAWAKEMQFEVKWEDGPLELGEVTENGKHAGWIVVRSARGSE